MRETEMPHHIGTQWQLRSLNIVEAHCHVVITSAVDEGLRMWSKHPAISCLINSFCYVFAHQDQFGTPKCLRVNHRAKNGMQSHDPTLHVTTDDKPTVGANSRSYCKVILQYSC